MASITYEELFDKKAVNFSIGMSPTGMNISNGLNFNFLGKTSSNDTIGQTQNFQPSFYYEYLKNYPTLRTFVNIFKAPILEAIDQINGQIKISTNTNNKKDDLITDAAIIVNNFFERCDFKNYLKSHLDDFILRGAYLSFIDYRQGVIRDTINPYEFLMIHNGRNYSWIIPKAMESKNGIRSLFTGTITSLENAEKGQLAMNGFPAYKFIKYYYQSEIITRETRKALIDMRNSNNENNIKTVLGGDTSIVTAQKLADEEKTRLDDILVLYTEERPKSLFEPYLKSLFLLSIKELVFDLISLLQYLKSDYFTVNARTSAKNSEKIASLALNIQAALNKYNLDILRTYEDPSGILMAVFDKIINRNEVLPINDVFSDIQLLQIPDIDQRLSVMYNDILDTKKRLADEIGIAQESISGNSNRWESISRNEKTALNEMAIKTSIEEFVKTTACNIVFNHMNEFYWMYRQTQEKQEPTTFNFSEELEKKFLFDNEPNGHINTINQYVINFNQQQKVPPGSSVGIMLQPSVFDFKLNLSLIIDSYASKTKESIISENIQSTSSFFELLRNFIQSNANLLDGSKVLDYVNELLTITDYSSSILDREKLKKFISQMQEEVENPAPPPEEGGEGYNDVDAYGGGGY